MVDSLPDDVRNFARQGRDMAANGAQAAADYASPRLASLRENLGLLHSQIRQVCVCARGSFYSAEFCTARARYGGQWGAGSLSSTVPWIHCFSESEWIRIYLVPWIQIQEQ